MLDAESADQNPHAIWPVVLAYIRVACAPQQSRRPLVHSPQRLMMLNHFMQEYNIVINGLIIAVHAFLLEKKDGPNREPEGKSGLRKFSVR